jgi:2-methylcitrate dehydratase
LIHGRLTARDYEDDVAHDPRVDALRARMEVRENPQFTADYYAADKRFIGNAIQIIFKDGTRTERIHVDTPIGHRRRRAEGYPVLVDKFRSSLPPVFPEKQRRQIETLFADPARLDAMPVDDFVAHLVRN